YQRRDDWPGAPEAWLPDGTRLTLPDDWRQTGEAFLDAFVHPDSTIFYLGGIDRFRKERWPADDPFERMELCLRERIQNRERRLKDVLEEQIPESARIALKPDLGRSAVWRRYAWPDSEWSQRALGERVSRESQSLLCKYFELVSYEEDLTTRMREGLPRER